jgi:hypothetical protein
MEWGQCLSIVASSGYFDERWYLEQYPDVKDSGLDPLPHYLQFGSPELRKPSPHFDAGWYRAKYAQNGIGNDLDLLIEFLGSKEVRFGSAHDLLRRKVTTPADQLTALLVQYADSEYPIPEPANDSNWAGLGLRWAEYFLARGATAYRNHDFTPALQAFKFAIQTTADSIEAYQLHRAAFTELNADALDAFQASLKGADLLVAHVTCSARMPLARISERSFNASSESVRHIIVVGNPALGPDRFTFDMASGVLEVPSSDAYEGLPCKVMSLFRFVGISSVDVPMLKLDDDIHCGNPGQLMRDLAELHERGGYGGGVIVPAKPFFGSTFWHMRKCSDSWLNEQPDSLLFGVPFVTGKYYWLAAPTVNALSKMTLIHERVFATEIYEDRAVGTVLHHYGVSPVQFDLVEAGSLVKI